MQRKFSARGARFRTPLTSRPASCRRSFGDYVQAFRLGGASFESADDEELNNWHERLNVLWRNIAGPNVALWTHVIRRRRDSLDSAVLGRSRRSVLRRRTCTTNIDRRLAARR